MIETLNGAIDALSATVFAKISLFGTPIEAIVLWLAIPMLLATLLLKFINLTGLGLAFRVLRTGQDKAEDGDVSQFAALSTALAGTIGLGNIAGVAIALTSGGPGAILWMFVIGWFAMTLKMAEVALGLKYRSIDANGHVQGGPMYTLKHGLASRGWPKIGLLLGGIYAFFALFGAIPLVQVNQSYAQVAAVTGFTSAWGYGIVMAVLVAAVVFGGAPWLGRVASRLTPFKVAVYMVGVFAILILQADAIPAALAAIWHGAWTGDAALGGAVGSFVVGMRRAVYSSEAGVGSAVMAHSLAKTDEPVSEGLVALLEPFFGTVIVCSLGGLAMVVAGTWDDGLQGIAVTSAAFASVADWFPILLAAAVFLFGYSTLCAWGFYGLQAWGYLFGRGAFASWSYKIIYVVILPIGAVLDLGRVIDLIDSAFFLMAIPNVLALYLFAPELRRDVVDYLKRTRARKAA